MTAQAPDILILEGRKVELLSNPLEAFWDEAHPRPRFVPATTASWRGYVATWALENDRLLLVRVEGSVCVDESGEIVPGRLDFMQESIGFGPNSTKTAPVSLQRLFPGVGGPIPATWFTGELRIPEGGCVAYMHMGYGSIYESELLLQINRGIVASSRRIETGEKWRRDAAALMASREEGRPARQYIEGWVVCPHCRARFTIRNKKSWDGERHRSCGGRISIEG